MKKIFLMCAVLATVGFMAGCGKDSPEPPETPGTEEPVNPEPPKPEVTYKVGDFYKKGFVTGIVVSVDETGAHGSVVSLDEVKTAWSYKYEEVMGSMPSMSGRKNTDAVYEADNWKETYPGFFWCSKKDPSEQLRIWFIPSRVELANVYVAYTGIAPETEPDMDSAPLPKATAEDVAARKKWFNDILVKNGGTPISDEPYWTSEETGKQMASALDMSNGSMITVPNLLSKELEHRFRAMANF